MTRFGTIVSVQDAIRGYDQANEEKVDNVEDKYTPHHLFRGSGDLLLWVGRFCGSQSGQLSASVGEGSGHEDAAEAMEAIEERSVR